MIVYFSNRFYYTGLSIAGLLVISWVLGISADFALTLLFTFSALTLLDAIVLFTNSKAVQCKRILSNRFSNGDDNTVQLKLNNNYPFKIRLKILEELPEQLQMRNHKFSATLMAGTVSNFKYVLRPVARGEYAFGHTVLLIQSPIGLIVKRKKSAVSTVVKVFPSFAQMQRYQLMAATTQQQEAGTKQMRKIGSSLEFEQIKEYVQGDDIRQLNWKATARRGSLMVNNYVDEKSQQVYCIIDKGRLMKMPFNNLTLLDYAINAALVLCKVSLQKQDKFGLLTFSHQPGEVLPASRQPIQLSHVLQTLYKLQTQYLESDFEKLYLQVRTIIKQRSLLVLFTNFESMSGLKRQLPYLKQMAKYHLLLVVFFENSELKEISEANADDLESVYVKTIAGRFVFEKKMIVKELSQHGILSLLTPPHQLTISAVNKYLELKQKQAI